MITSTAKGLAGLAVQLRERQKVGREVAVWKNHATTLAQLSAELRDVQQFLSWLSGIDASASQGPRVAVKTATAVVSNLSDTLRNDPDRVLTGELVPNTRAAVEKVTELLQEQARSSWSAYVDRINWINADLWAAFRSSVQVGDLVAEAERMDATFSRLRARPFLATEVDRAAFAALIPAHADLVARLPDISDQEVRDFVVAASGSGAAIQALTPTVMDWLDNNGLGGLYVVRRAADGNRN